MQKPSFISFLRAFVFGATLSLLLPSSFVAQTTAARPDRGIMPGASYSVSDIENISLTNGNLQLTIPLASLPPIAGGKLKFTVNAVYNSKLWNVTRQENQLGQFYGCPSWVVDTPQLSDLGGWRIPLGYQLVFRNAHEDFDYVVPAAPPTPDCETDVQEQLRLQSQYYRAILITPDGAEHELRPTDNYARYGGTRSYLQNYYKDIPNTVNGAMRYYSFDGSYLYAVVNPSSNSTSWTVYMNDGTRIVQYSNGIQRITDTNGNSIKIFSDASGAHIQDEHTGREVRVHDNKVWYQTVTGAQQSVEIVTGTTLVQGKIYQVSDWSPTGGETGGGFVCTRNDLLTTSVPVIREIIFPATEPGISAPRYSFSYNSDTTSTATDDWRLSCGMAPQPYTRTVSNGMGELSQVVTPSEAVIKYSYSKSSIHNFSMDANEFPRATVTQKQVIHDGITDTWTYNITEFAGCGGVVTAPDGSTSTEQCYPHDPAWARFFGYDSSGGGLVYRSSRSREVVERHWIFQPFGGANTGLTGDLGITTFNPVVDAEYFSLLDGSGNPVKMSARKFQYDFNGNLVQQIDYDWFDPSLVSRGPDEVPTSVPGSATVLRTTNYSHYNQAATAGSANVYAKRSLTTATPLILSAPQQMTLGPSIAQFSYDGQAYNVAPTVGNLTGKRVWADLDNKWITTSSTYDVYGNVVSTTDGRGKVTQYLFDDATHALPNRIVVDPQNGTGTQTTTTVYDYATGRVTSVTDSNGATSTIDYTNQLLSTVDPFGRPGVTITPLVNAGGVNQHRRVTNTYEDHLLRVVVASDLSSENDKLLRTRTTTDMLGRPILVEQTEDGTNYTLYSQQAYAQGGRISFSSSAMRAGSSSNTDSWTRATQDSMGRVIEIATFGGATQPPNTGTTASATGIVTTVYDANFTTVTDQAGKVRRSMVDALGRLVRVDEPDSNNSLGSTTSPVQSTGYSYDLFGNLLTVTQAAQTRTFTYDSLSRLRSAANPESGAITYQYDDNGNLTQKTDARGVVSAYTYDALNRNITIDYSNTVGINPDVSRFYDGATSGKGRFWYSYAGGSESAGSNVEKVLVDSYDALGRPLVQRQLFKFNGTWSAAYQVSRNYNLSGSVVSETYPSGHTVSYGYDGAGRVSSFSGNLGDGTTRTYSTGITYGSAGQMKQEQFGTTTAVYNKLFYNSRQQLAEILVSTTGGDSSWNRGKILNQYSLQCSGVGCNATDNNSNLRKQEVYIPPTDQVSSDTSWYQQYDYDELNRLKRVHEYTATPALDWQQEYLYDRWGNRRIDVANTYGTGINNKSFEKDDASNRLHAPGDLELADSMRRIRYDAAGNQTRDTYTGYGEASFDAENHIIAIQGNSSGWSNYTYNADGQRTRRKINNQETWQIYGLDGELLAEYPSNGAVGSPQKEYGYRNGQLLVTAEAAASSHPNVALASSGATVSSSSTLSPYVASHVIDGSRQANNNTLWLDNTFNSFGDWVEVSFNGSKTINEIDVVTQQDDPNNLVEPTLTQTFSLYGITAFEVQYWNDSAWATVPGGSVTGNNKVWRQFTFSPITTTKIRVVVNGGTDNAYSRVVEVEAWTGTAPPPAANYASASNGGFVTASSTLSSYGAGNVIDGSRRALNNTLWLDNTFNSFGDWVEINFNGSKTISEIDVITQQDDPNNLVEPTLTQTFSLYGITAFEVQYWNDSAWATVPGGSVTGNNKVWRQFTFTPITTTKIRVVVNGGADNAYSRVVEVEAWGQEPTASTKINWLVTDQLGTPRMVLDQTGSLANVKRHDYLPFGEELFAPTGVRNTTFGYGSGDGVRQQFTQKERDVETGLDYFLARYYSSTQGRFSSPDPLLSSGRVTEPQSWNRYNYCSNNPLNIIDPNGLDWWYLKDSENPSPVWFDQDPGTDYVRWTNTYDYVYYDNAARQYAVLDPTGNSAFVTNTLERANELFDTYFAGSLGVGGQAEGEFLGGLGSGASPFGILITQVHAAAGMDTTSRDYMTGQVLGGGLGGGLGLFGSVISKGTSVGFTQLNKQIKSDAQLTQVAAGQGKPIIGAGTSKALQDAPRLAAQYGGNASDWAKVTSWSYKAADGTRIEIHAYQHIPTGKVVEFKTKIQ